MATRWRAVHHPAAMKWVRNREDARRYCEESAAEIYVVVDGQNVCLAGMDQVDREAWVARFLERFDLEGWLPMTLTDGRAAVERARSMAPPGSTPVVAVATDKGVLFQSDVPRKGS